MSDDLGDDAPGDAMNIELLLRRGLLGLFKLGVFGVDVVLPGNLVLHNNLVSGKSHLI
jgi:hypothetical protein